MRVRPPLGMLMAACLLASCASINESLNNINGFARITTEKDEFDGTIWVKMSRAFIRKESAFSTPAFEMEAAWSNKFPNSIVLIPILAGIYQVSSLEVNIDGEIFELSGQRGLSDWKSPTFTYSGGLGASETRHEFFATSDQVRKMLAGNKVILRIITTDGYDLGYFSTSAEAGDATAKRGLAKMLVAIEQARPTSPSPTP